jgi:hypothetical protein
MSIDLGEFRIVKRIDSTAPQLIDNLAVDPNNPNANTDDGLLLPAVQDHGLLLPAVRDHGLLLPAVKTDDGLLLPAVTDGTSNTFMFGEVVKPSLPADDEVLVAFEFGDKGADYSGSHVLYQDINIPTPAPAQLEKFLSDEPGRQLDDGLWLI